VSTSASAMPDILESAHDRVHPPRRPGVLPTCLTFVMIGQRRRPTGDGARLLRQVPERVSGRCSILECHRTAADPAARPVVRRVAAVRRAFRAHARPLPTGPRTSMNECHEAGGLPPGARLLVLGRQDVSEGGRLSWCTLGWT
jgi:hypothetical protein